jgi:hypothetical protein
MGNIAGEPYREIDFSRAKRGPVVPLEAGKTKISIRLDNRVIDHFRAIVEKAGGGNYQTLINDSLVAYIEQRSVLDAVRQVVREEMAAPRAKRGPTSGSTRARTRAARPGSPKR